jgi:hypothetical protein
MIMVDGGPLTLADCQDRYDAWESYRLWSVVGYATSAAFAVTSAVLFLTSRPTPTTPPNASARLTCTPTLSGLSCQGLF